MRRGLRTLIACSALAVFVAACGSSGKPSTSAATTATGATRSAGSTPKTTSSPGGELKVTTTPKFATPEASAPVRSGVVQIAYREIAIDPDTVRVKVGSTIKWTNYDSVDHNVTSVGPGPVKLASGEFGEGHTFEVKVEKPGIIHYESTTQPTTMNGTIEVVK
jgi:plastocyanin